MSKKTLAQRLRKHYAEHQALVSDASLDARNDDVLLNLNDAAPIIRKAIECAEVAEKPPAQPGCCNYHKAGGKGASCGDIDA